MSLKRERALETIEEQASEPSFWNDQDAAQKLLQRRSGFERAITARKSLK